MRKLIILIISLIVGKISYQDYLFRASTREVIVSTFQERALQVCQRHAKTSVVTATGAIPAQAWSKPASVALVIGKSGLDVWLWQVDSAQWNARYRNPYLLIIPDRVSSTASAASLACEYDILNGSAQVYKL